MHVDVNDVMRDTLLQRYGHEYGQLVRVMSGLGNGSVCLHYAVRGRSFKVACIINWYLSIRTLYTIVVVMVCTWIVRGLVFVLVDRPQWALLICSRERKC